MTTLPTSRLSPKHQVTLPREARGLLQVRDGGVVCGMQHKIRRDDGATFPILLVFTEEELQRREDAIINDDSLTSARRFELVTKLNGGVRRMAVDGQNRIVLPKHFVGFLKLERDAFFVCTNTTTQIWLPEDYLRWSGMDQDDHVETDLDDYLMI